MAIDEADIGNAEVHEYCDISQQIVHIYALSQYGVILHKSHYPPYSLVYMRIAANSEEHNDNTCVEYDVNLISKRFTATCIPNNQFETQKGDSS